MSNKKHSESLSTIWGEYLKSWQKKDLNQSAYYHEHHLNYHRFTYWRRKLSGQTTKKRKQASHSAFAPVQTSTPLTTPKLGLSCGPLSSYAVLTEP